MFNSDFYPTSKEVCQRLARLIEVDFHNRNKDSKFNFSKYKYSDIVGNVLEPSAGKGDLADFFCKRTGYAGDDLHRKSIDCIENDPTLVATLQGLGYPVVDTDFLSFAPKKSYRFIIMNPPFSDGVHHALKALEIAENQPGDCTVVCLLNSETLNNRENNKYRQLLYSKLTDNGATFEDLGQCFKTAERTTNVNVTAFIVNFSARENKVKFSGFETKSFENVDFEENTPALHDYIDGTVQRYEAAEQALTDVYKAKAKYEFYLTNKESSAESLNQTLEEETVKLRQDFWNEIFAKSKLKERVTSQWKKKFSEYMNANTSLAFSKANIILTLKLLIDNQQQIQKDCILSVFDAGTSFDEKNRIHFEGWKSNSCYKLNKKIIIPHGIEFKYSGNGVRIRTTYSYANTSSDFLRDIDYVMCWLDGTNREQIKTVEQALNESTGWDGEIESTYFKIRYFKKLTVHLTFKDLKLSDRFNLAVAQYRNWIAPENDRTHCGICGGRLNKEKMCKSCKVLTQ